MTTTRLARAGAVPSIDRRTVIGVLLAVLAGVLVLVITRPPASTPVIVAGGDLPAGVPLSDLPVEIRHVADAGGLVVGDSLGELADWTLAVPLRSGEPLVPSMLRPPELMAAPGLLALALDESHAVLGRLAPGDRVDVYVTHSSPGAEPATALLAEDVYIVEARTGGGGVGTPQVELLVAVDDDLAARLTAALRSGDIDLVRTGP
jgi:Flp pilus assembly protein CpaB